MTISGLILCFLAAIWSLIVAVRERHLCDMHGRPVSEWAWLCLIIFVFFAGMSVNGIITLHEQGFH